MSNTNMKLRNYPHEVVVYKPGGVKNRRFR
jgi:hypothetical protein